MYCRTRPLSHQDVPSLEQRSHTKRFWELLQTLPPKPTSKLYS